MKFNGGFDINTSNKKILSGVALSKVTPSSHIPAYSRYASSPRLLSHQRTHDQEGYMPQSQCQALCEINKSF